MRNPPHGDIELMAQIQVLDLEPAPRLEPVEDKSKEQVKQCKHRDGRLPNSLSYCQAHADGIFGNDTFHNGHYPPQISQFCPTLDTVRLHHMSLYFSECRAIS